MVRPVSAIDRRLDSALPLRQTTARCHYRETTNCRRTPARGGDVAAMTCFWLICALFIVIAFAFVLPIALQRNDKSQKDVADERKRANIAVYRDQLSELEADLENGIVSQEQYAQDRDEIERRLLEDTRISSSKDKPATAPAGPRSTAYALGLGIPVVAVIFYLNVGNPKAVTGDAAVNSPANATAPASGERTQEQIEANVAALAKRLQANPSDAQGWVMLARSYSSMQKFSEAAGAYAKATELTPDNADLWSDYAFASAM